MTNKEEKQLLEDITCVKDTIMEITDLIDGALVGSQTMTSIQSERLLRDTLIKIRSKL